MLTAARTLSTTGRMGSSPLVVFVTHPAVNIAANKNEASILLFLIITFPPRESALYKISNHFFAFAVRDFFTFA